MGGRPIPFARPALGRDEFRAVRTVLKSGWLTTGKEAMAFEAEFAQFVGARHAVSVNSATAGLHLALAALGIGPGDAVLVPTFTFVATAEVVHYLQAEPVFVDIDRATYNIDPAGLPAALDKARERGLVPRAIIPVHVAGRPCDMPRLLGAAAELDLAVVEDAAHAFPVQTATGHVGTLGTAGVYSFYATKPITTGEGGMLVTNHDGIADVARQLRLHGIDRDVWRRYTDVGSAWRYDVTANGFKYNMPDTAAALGRVQLRRADRLKEQRLTAARHYVEAFCAAGVPHGLTVPDIQEPHAHHLFIVEIDARTVDGGRDGVHADLAAVGIGSSVHFIPVHSFAYYKEGYGYTDGSFPNAWEAFESVLSLPLYAGLDRRRIRRVVEAVVDSVSRRARGGRR